MVGLHPDQATEPLVDYALMHQLPFAVVPCCVHARAFPHRKIIRTRNALSVGSDDKDESSEFVEVSVRTYDDFLEYLMSKSPLIQRSVLPISGRNVVLFVTSY